MMPPRTSQLRLAVVLGPALACSPPAAPPTDTSTPPPIAAPADPKPTTTPAAPADPKPPAPAESLPAEPAAPTPETPPASNTPSSDPLASSGHFRAVLESETKTGPPKGMDPDIIRRTIKKKIASVSDCYNAGLKKDPTLRGRVEVEFEIDLKGTPTVRKTTSDLKNGATVEKCIAAIFKTLTFPKPTEKIIITYPFVLEPG